MDTPDKDVIYIGIFLDPMDTQRLIRTFGQLHPVKLAHHMTIFHFKEGGIVPLNLPWGKTVALKVIGHAEDARVQAVVVEPPAGLRRASGVPHITISTAEGASAKMSNDLLATWNPGDKVHGLLLKGKVGWVDSLEQVHFTPPPTAPD